MKRILFIFSFCLFIFAGTFYSNAQGSNELTLKDIYTTRKFSSKGISSMRWMKDNVSYSTLERNEKVGGRDIVRYDVKTGERSVIVSASMLIPAPSKCGVQGEAEGLDCPSGEVKNSSASNGAQGEIPARKDVPEVKPVVVEDYYWSEDNTKLLIYSNSSRVWRTNTRGDYWVLNLNSGEFRQIGLGLEKIEGVFEPSRMMFAKFSPAADKVAFVYYNNIYVEDMASGEVRKLTFDGSDDIVNGTFDWVYEEELGLQDGFRWSPDGRSIAFWNCDTRGTGVFYMINNVDSLYSKVIPFPYPKAGTPNSAVKVGVVDIASAQSRWFDIPGDPRNHYIARMEFIPNSGEVMIQQLNRLQNTNRVFVGDIATMSLNNIYTDKDEAFLDIHDNIVWMEGEKFFTWTSEKDGWRHLYKVSRDGTSESLITKGDFDVIGVECIDLKGGYVYYLASPQSAVDQYLYRSRLDGKGEAERVTPQGEAGFNGYSISPNAKYALHTFNNSVTPYIYDLVSLPKHKTVRVLEDNAALKATYDALNLSKKEFFRVDIGEAVLDGWMIKPRDFDPLKKYPVIFYIYGEPASSTVLNTWGGGNLWNHFLAEQGYVVMSIDPRGTNMPKGRVWRKSIYGAVGNVGPKDHAEAVGKVLDENPFIDRDRVGIWGWSGGGSSTMHAMFKYPDIYKVGISVAGVSLQNLYDTIYQERYMGLPSTNSDGFYNGSPINFADGLKGKFLLIHGTGDDNVHYQCCEMLINKLVECNKMFSLMSYPMRSHGIYERPNTSYHLYQTMFRFWQENL